MDLYTIGMVYSRVYVVTEIFFCFSFVFAVCSSKMKTRHVTHYRFTEKVLSCMDNFQHALALDPYRWHGQFKLYVDIENLFLF